MWDDWEVVVSDCGPGRPPSTIRHGNRGRPDLGTPCCGHWGMFFWVLQDRQTYSESAGSSAPERAWEADNRDHRGLSTQVMRDQWVYSDTASGCTTRGHAPLHLVHECALNGVDVESLSNLGHGVRHLLVRVAGLDQLGGHLRCTTQTPTGRQ